MRKRTAGFWLIKLDIGHAFSIISLGSAGFLLASSLYKLALFPLAASLQASRDSATSTVSEIHE